jgi:hypothetical protein
VEFRWNLEAPCVTSVINSNENFLQNNNANVTTQRLALKLISRLSSYHEPIPLFIFELRNPIFGKNRIS